MAQTRRKRRTKHRGNAAGIVEHRGRTSRPPDPKDRKEQRRDTAGRARAKRQARPPSWRSAANRAVIATVVFIAIVIVFFHTPARSAIPLGAFMLLVYIPVGYFTDSFFYKRRQQQIAKRGR